MIFRHSNDNIVLNISYFSVLSQIFSNFTILHFAFVLNRCFLIILLMFILKNLLTRPCDQLYIKSVKEFKTTKSIKIKCVIIKQSVEDYRIK